MEDRNKQRMTKLIKVFTKLIPLFMVCFFMAMLPLPHTLRLIGFIGSLVFFISVFIMDALLVYLLFSPTVKVNEKTRKIMTFLAIASPILTIVVTIILLFFIYPEI